MIYIRYQILKIPLLKRNISFLPIQRENDYLIETKDYDMLSLAFITKSLRITNESKFSDWSTLNRARELNR